MRNVLIEFTHGLGDAVQLTCVLQHLRKYRPDWEVSLWALHGKHSVGHGLCKEVFSDRVPKPRLQQFDQVYNLGWYECYSVYGDSPSTKVSNCLREVFQIKPDPSLMRYSIQVSPEARCLTADWLEGMGAKKLANGRYNVVAMHYEGNTAPDKKNMKHETAGAICDVILESGFIPMIFDWDKRSPLPDGRRIICPSAGYGDVWGSFGSGDAERITAMIQHSSAMIGVDSGPGHCAGATDTPTIMYWKGHTPIQFYDLCPNVLHVIPENIRHIPPCGNDTAYKYMMANYRTRIYPTFSPLAPIIDELRTILHVEAPEVFLLHGLHVHEDNADGDLVIIKEVFQENTYKLNLLQASTGPEVVFDIGAHIGCFTKLWHDRNPEAQITCVEVAPENIDLLKKNVGSYARIVQAACTYEKADLCLLNTIGHKESDGTGGSRVVTREVMEAEQGWQYWKDARPIKTITIEELMELAGVDFIHILKMDCEGSEFSILENAPLDRIKTILVESHDRKRWRKLLNRHFVGWDIVHLSAKEDGVEMWHLHNLRKRKR